MKMYFLTCAGICLENCTPTKVTFLILKNLEICSRKAFASSQKIRNNMKNRLMDLNDRFMLKRRSIVETVIDSIKNICHTEYARHRSLINFFNNILSAIRTYCFESEKPKLRNQKAKHNNFNPLQLSHYP